MIKFNSYYEKIKIPKLNDHQESHLIYLNNLIYNQLESYNFFLEKKHLKKNKHLTGLHKLFNEMFPIRISHKNSNTKLSLKYLNYYCVSNNQNLQKCKSEGITFSTKILLLLEIQKCNEKSKNNHSFDKILLDIGKIPLMTSKGTFIINGIEKVIVSQFQRSPGIYLESVSKNFKNIQLVPQMGSWIQLETNNYDLISIRINKKIQIPIYPFLISLNICKYNIINHIFSPIELQINESSIYKKKSNLINLKNILNKSTIAAIIDKNNKRLIFSKNTNINKKDYLKIISSKINTFKIYKFKIKKLLKEGHCIFILKKNSGITSIQFINMNNIKYSKNTKYYLIHKKKFQDSIKYNLLKQLIILNDYTIKQFQNIVKQLIYVNLKTQNKSNTNILNELFFNNSSYDLSETGKLNLQIVYGKKNNSHNLEIFNVLDMLKSITNISSDMNYFKNVDFNEFSNRKVATTYNLLYDLVKDSFKSIKKLIINNLLLNYKTNLTDNYKESIIKSFNFVTLKVNLHNFFNSSSLSQFADQINPLSEIVHKRRLTLLGPNGLSYESATLDNRDINLSIYSKICPIESPEGHNVGLVNVLSIYTLVNIIGKVDVAYHKVHNSKTTQKIHQISSFSEKHYNISDKLYPFYKLDTITKQIVKRNNLFLYKNINSLNYINNSSKQILSISSSLVPFLEHNDASRSLMGSNMQRQAVPLINSEIPLISTGMERIVLRDSESNIKNNVFSKVSHVDNNNVIVTNNLKYDKSIKNIKTSKSFIELNYKLQMSLINNFKLIKLSESNQNTLVNHKVHKNLKINKFIARDDVIAEGFASQFNELSLGKNVFVAFMSFGGYSFEDSITLSESIIKKNSLSSIILESIDIMESKSSNYFELFTNKVFMSNKFMKHRLDIDGIIKKGTLVQSGDLVVGKLKFIKNKEDNLKSNVSVYQKENFSELIKYIEDSQYLDYNIIDVSEKIAKGKRGKIVNIKKFFKIKKQVNSLTNINLNNLLQYYKYQEIIYNFFIKQLYYLIINNEQGNSYNVIKYDVYKWFNEIANLNLNLKIRKLLVLINYFNSKLNVNKSINKKKNRLISFKNLIKNNENSLKMVRLYLALKHSIKPGDKITGRYGNKGIISQIIPSEDMPYTSDGVPLDIILNPISISSRMNIGQILETHLGWASLNISKQIQMLINSNNLDFLYRDLKSKIYNLYKPEKEQKFISYMNTNNIYKFLNCLSIKLPISIDNFNSNNDEFMYNLYKKSKLNNIGQIYLFDGKTGARFNKKITVGNIYILKLNHFVDNKLHARSIGPYNLITKQPLVGKSQLGGQRFGEMEVWSLQGYGAAYTLQEILTIKSDSVLGKESFMKILNNQGSQLGGLIPQSFDVLIREIWSLSLDLKLIN